MKKLRLPIPSRHSQSGRRDNLEFRTFFDNSKFVYACHQVMIDRIQVVVAWNCEKSGCTKTITRIDNNIIRHSRVSTLESRVLT